MSGTPARRLIPSSYLIWWGSRNLPGEVAVRPLRHPWLTPAAIMSFSHSELGDDFVDAWSDSERGHPSPVAPAQPAPAAASSGAFAGWLDKSSARHSNPPVYMYVGDFDNGPI